MSNNSNSLISITDFFGIGKLSDSKAAERLVDAIIRGCGRVVGPWLLKREVKTHLELERMAAASLGVSFDAEMTLDDRSRLVLTTQRYRHQQNREAIAAKAIAELKESPVHDEETESEIDPDWLSHFWKLAETVSDEQMQEIWARVLSGTSAGIAYSARTLDLLRTLSKDEAKLIEQLAAFKVAIGPDHPYWRTSIGLLNRVRLVLPGQHEEAPERIFVKGRTAVDADIGKRGIEVGHLIKNPFSNLFGPMGLYVESGFSHTFALNWKSAPLPIQIGSRRFEIIGIHCPEGDDLCPIVFGDGIGFSQVGWELFSLAKVPPNEEYLALIRGALEAKGLALQETDSS